MYFASYLARLEHPFHSLTGVDNYALNVVPLQFYRRGMIFLSTSLSSFPPKENQHTEREKFTKTRTEEVYALGAGFSTHCHRLALIGVTRPSFDVIEMGGGT